jgi:CHAT domain-containing protein
MEDWLLPLQQGRHQVAWDRFLSRHRKLIFASIRHYTHDYDEGMEVFAHVCEKLGADDMRLLRARAEDPNPRARFTTWLVVVVRHAAVDWFRHRDGRRRLSALAAGIRTVTGTSTAVLKGPAASESALRFGAPGYDVLHLATFGVLNKHNPLFSYVELGGEGGDSRLEVHEVFALELDGQLVVLSACQTALASGASADVPPGDDWVGLTQAFLQAGAGGVLASLWRVEDRATARLMQHFYRLLATGESAAAALAGAQRTLLREDGLNDPFYWGGFILSGTASGPGLPPHR